MKKLPGIKKTFAFNMWIERYFTTNASHIKK